MFGTPTYSSWSNMLSRCNNPKTERYSRYGGRGIRVCERWHTFALFFEDMGTKPEGYSIERKDPDGHYEPGNCCWLPKAKQARNQARTVWVEFEGERYALPDLAEMHGIPPRVANQRVKGCGWDPVRAATEPVQ